MAKEIPPLLQMTEKEGVGDTPWNIHHSVDGSENMSLIIMLSIVAVASLSIACLCLLQLLRRIVLECHRGHGKRGNGRIHYDGMNSRSKGSDQ